MKNIHLVIPFSRFHLLDTLIKHYESMNIILHPIVFETEMVSGTFEQSWIEPMIIPNDSPKNWIIAAHAKVNYFIQNHKFIDDDYFCFFADDDGI